MSEITITRDESIMIVTINRPHRRNAINKTTAEALRQAWLDFDADDTARVGILTGGDEVFCAGADLKEIETMGFNTPDGPLGFTRMFVNKPTIAAIAGYAVAGGLEIACWCDLRIADETAVFGCYERRFGVPLIDGGTQRLPRIVGMGRALDMILTGRSVDVKEAYTIGLVNEITPKGRHLKRAILTARLLAAFPQNCLISDRRAVYEGIGRPLAEGLQLEAEIGAKVVESGETYRGAQTFREGTGRGGKVE
jgi:enoyl-CoA hydratase